MQLQVLYVKLFKVKEYSHFRGFYVYALANGLYTT